MKSGLLIAAAAHILLGCAPTPPAPAAPPLSRVAAPQRIVSLDYCADQYVLKFADHAQIAALSPDADSSFSYMAEAARGLPQTLPHAESIIGLQPDLVVRAYGGGPRMASLLARAGIPTLQLGYANDIKGVEENMARASHAFAHAERGAAEIARMRARFQTLRAAASNKRVLYVTPGGVTSGSGSLIDAIMTSAGYQNYVSAPGWRSLPLESLAEAPPDLILFASFGAEADQTDRWSPARHAVIHRALAQTPRVNVPGAATACGAWFAADIAEALARAAP